MPFIVLVIKDMIDHVIERENPTWFPRIYGFLRAVPLRAAPHVDKGVVSFCVMKDCDMMCHT
jgi:hypothetical protein